MTEEEMIARGEELFQQCYNGVVPLPENIKPDSFAAFNMKLFNEVWSDDCLTFAERRLAVLGVMAGRGADPSLFAIHARSALRNKELNAAQLRSLMRVFVNYAGAPATTPLFIALEKLLHETDDGKNA